MDVVAYERGFAALVGAEQALVQVAGGFRFVEGPVWVPAGTARASSARKTPMAAVETSGSTSATPRVAR